MTTQRKMGIRIVLLIILALLALHLPGMGLTKAYAADKSITGLGTGSIQNPVKGVTEHAFSAPWTGNYVYYGKYNNSPVKYRVLTTKTSSFGGSTMLLDCNDVLLRREFDEGNLNVWETSSLRTFLNGAGFYSNEDVFTAAEHSAIAASTKNQVNENDGSGGDGLSFAPLAEDHIFILDAVEATCPTYGYDDYGKDKNSNSGSLTRLKNNINNWWLRSPASDPMDKIFVGGIRNVGYLDMILTGVRAFVAYPVFNVDLSAIMFSSLVSGTAGTSGAEYKLTLKDNSMSIKKDGDYTERENNHRTIFRFRNT